MNQKLSIAGVAVMLLFLIATMTTAQAQTIADLSSDELKKLIDQTADVLVIDTRTAREFYDGHIVGAVNISSQASNQFRSLPLFLPQDKDTPLVFYCRGYT
jgi:rhodanese-related sulfurtransferase